MSNFVRDIDEVVEHEYSDECLCEHCRHETMLQNVREAFNKTFQWECHTLTVGMFLMELKKRGYLVTETD